MRSAQWVKYGIPDLHNANCFSQIIVWKCINYSFYQKETKNLKQKVEGALRNFQDFRNEESTVIVKYGFAVFSNNDVNYLSSEHAYQYGNYRFTWYFYFDVLIATNNPKFPKEKSSFSKKFVR